MSKTKLGRRLYQLIENAVKINGTFDPDKIGYCYIEDLTADEYKKVRLFLKWLHASGKTMGSGNYETRFTEYLIDTGKAKVETPNTVPQELDGFCREGLVDEKMPRLSQEPRERDQEYATRLLCSMFQEVYSHTGREMPTEMYDRASDVTRALLSAVREEYAVVSRDRY
jgi:hypothetical protein